MVDFNSPMLKPTMLLTRSPFLSLGSVGRRKVKKVKKVKRGNAPKKTLCRKYFDSKGRPAFAGTKALKESQLLARIDKLLVHIETYHTDASMSPNQDNNSNKHTYTACLLCLGCFCS